MDSFSSSDLLEGLPFSLLFSMMRTHLAEGFLFVRILPGIEIVSKTRLIFCGTDASDFLECSLHIFDASSSADCFPPADLSKKTLPFLVLLVSCSTDKQLCTREFMCQDFNDISCFRGSTWILFSVQHLLTG